MTSRAVIRLNQGVRLICLGIVPLLMAQAPAQETVELVGPTEVVHVEPVTLTPQGFDPPKLVRPRGPFILLLHNRSGLKDDLDIDIDAADKKVKTVKLLSKHYDFGEVLRLPPGLYTVRVKGKGHYTLAVEVKP